MSPKQKALYFKTWQAVHRQCPELDRHEFHIQIFGKDKSSLAFTDKDLDKFLEVAWRITKPADVNAQLRQMNQQKTRLIWKIEVYLANFLRLYREDPAAYTLSIIRDQLRFALPEDKSTAELRPVLETLDVPQLENLRSTLTARLNELRNHAGHTIHDMHILAGVQCDCAPCAKRRRLAAINHEPAESTIPF